jgi:hypothetical protein
MRQTLAKVKNHFFCAIVYNNNPDYKYLQRAKKTIVRSYETLLIDCIGPRIDVDEDRANCAINIDLT